MRGESDDTCEIMEGRREICCYFIMATGGQRTSSIIAGRAACT